MLTEQSHSNAIKYTLLQDVVTSTLCRAPKTDCGEATGHL